MTGEILSTTAVSSTVRPPKKRISTTWTFGVDARERVQRIVQSDEAHGRVVAHDDGFVQRDVLNAASTFEIVPARVASGEHRATRPAP